MNPNEIDLFLEELPFFPKELSIKHFGISSVSLTDVYFHAVLFHFLFAYTNIKSPAFYSFTL